jgi:hypothetical protein
LPPTTSTTSVCVISNPGVYNTVFDACYDTDLYESIDEPRPSFELIENTAKNLRCTPIAKADIAPYFGEINVTWKADGRRVKAIFGPAPTSFCVYREQMNNGRVTYKHLEPKAEPRDLHTSIEWLWNPTLNV